VPKLDDDNVVALQQPLDLGEAPLVGVAARRPAADGAVDDGERDVPREVFAPACKVSRGGSFWRPRYGLTHVRAAGSGHGAVSGEVDGGVRLPSDLNGAGMSQGGEPSQGKRRQRQHGN
jgi:hypothetical protein